MGKPLMIQEEDNDQIEFLKEKIKAKTKIDVLRTALNLLAEKIEKEEQQKQWEKAVHAVGNSGMETLKDFKITNRFRNLK